ncbi:MULTISPECIES: head-tail connector protein [Klebsiella]|uniref:head-tail connector protein n=1 Tax=Klebsiella TaxID=570 RepID=UPI000575242E|nr:MULTISPECIES: head-tail connector protein [Klebsiella]KHM13216.1 phage gp6-like head-tail connector family protein [Klebsiella aerogenes]SWY00435.1 phage QLRG family, putative DNA packaging [Klebsiella pneumoniae]
MLLSMEEIKAQLRLDDDFSDEDTLLALLGKAAQSRAENYLNRRLYETASDRPEDDPDGLVMPDDIKLALLMLVSHFYENRSAVTEVEKLELPMSFIWLVGPYRYIPL